MIDRLSDAIDRLEERIVYLEGARADAEDRIDELIEASTPPKVRFKKLHPDAQLPRYQTTGAAGMDLVACNDETMLIFPEAVVCVPTGLAIELPSGFEAQVRPRSGLSLKGVAVANSPGTVDEDYRGEIKVIIRNHGQTFTVKKGDRIAQLVIARAVQADVSEVTEMSATERGSGGFGHTGTK